MCFTDRIVETIAQNMDKNNDIITRPGAQALRAHQHTFCSHSKTHFKQKFRQNTLKNTYFFEKNKINYKNRHSVRGFAHEFLLASGGWWLRPQAPMFYFR